MSTTIKKVTKEPRATKTKQVVPSAPVESPFLMFFKLTSPKGTEFNFTFRQTEKPDDNPEAVFLRASEFITTRMKTGWGKGGLITEKQIKYLLDLTNEDQVQEILTHFNVVDLKFLSRDEAAEAIDRYKPQQQNVAHQ